MSDQITLSLEELSLIKAKREKEEAEKKVKAAEVEIKRAKEIVDKEAEIAKFLVEQDIINKSYETFFAEFDKNYYELKKTIKTKIYVISEYDGTKRNITWTKEITYLESIIVRNNSNIKVLVREHKVYNGNRWHYHSNSKGLKMFIEGISYDKENKAYSKVSTVMEKIDEYLKQKETKEKNEIYSNNLFDNALKELSERYPKAKCEKNEKLLHCAGYKNTYTTYKTIKVTFENGIVINFTFNLIGEKIKFHIYSTDYTAEIDILKVSDLLQEF